MTAKPKRKVGRPRAEIDRRQALSLAFIQCSDIEIAMVMGVSQDTLHGYLSDELDQERERGRNSLRRVQYQQAVEQGNTTMLIWLGKQYLGQADKVEAKNQNDTTIRDETRRGEIADALADIPEPADRIAALRRMGQVAYADSGNGNGSE